jgi:predicted hydrocarbon binding protein
MSAEGEFFYPNRWALIVLTSAEEIVGDKGVAALLNMAGLQEYIGGYPPDNMKKDFPFDHVARLQKAFGDMYGPRGARVFSTRAGQQSFKDGLARFGSVKQAFDLAMRVGTFEQRMNIALGFFAKWFNTVSDQVVSTEITEDHWVWYIERCPMCWGLKSDQPICHLAVGVLQAAATFASQGNRYRVDAVECIAVGAPRGVIKVQKEPIG